MQDVENLFIEATKAIDDSDLSVAKTLLEEILMIDPGNSRAHNYLGWIYETRLKDFEKASRHYELSIKFGKSDYPVVYVNYAYLLIEFDYYEKALEIIKLGLKVQGADKATLIYQIGKIAESNQNFFEALEMYKQSRMLSFSKDFMNMLENELERVYSKLNFQQKIRAKFKGLLK